MKLGILMGHGEMRLAELLHFGLRVRLDGETERGHAIPRFVKEYCSAGAMPKNPPPPLSRAFNARAHLSNVLHPHAQLSKGHRVHALPFSYNGHITSGGYTAPGER
jgi:hypothetical protein